MARLIRSQFLKMKCFPSRKLVHRGSSVLGVAAIGFLLGFGSGLLAVEPLPLPDPPKPDFGDNSTAPAPGAEAEPEFTFYVKQIRVRGSELLSRGEIENAIYPYLGPGRSLDDLDQARAALEKAFRDIHVAVQHGAALPQYYEGAGKVLLGLRPSDPGW